MNIWRILGIDPTADKAAITAAYRSRLSGANPEDDPEAFKQLRAAYEQALALAKQAAAADSGTLNEADRWIAQVDEVYRDVRRRRNAAEWQWLLNEEYCQRPANRVQARDNLLRYLAEHYFLPHAIWQLLEETFSLRQNAPELRGLFPPAFIDNVVLPGIAYREQVPYEPLECEDGADCDVYLRTCSQCFRALADGQADQAQALLERMESCRVHHPYTDLCRARLARLRGQLDQAQELVDVVLSQMPGDVQTMLVDAQLAAQREDYEKTERILRQILNTTPHLAQAKFDLALCLSRSGRKREAKALYLELVRMLPNNQVILDALNKLNQQLLPELEQRYASCSEDTGNAIELAWCYHQLHKSDKANEIVEALPGELAGTLEYENLASKVKLARREWKDALAHLRVWELALRQKEPVDTVRLIESQRLQACSLFSLGQQEKAMALLKELSCQWPKDSECRKLLAQFCLRANRLDEALKAAGQYRELMPEDPTGTFLCGEVLFRMRRLQEAYDAFGKTMELAGSRDAGCLLYQCRILLLANQWEDAKKLLTQLEEAKVTGPVMEFCQGQLANHERRSEAALKHYQALLPVCRRENPPDFAGEVFFRLVCLQYNSLNTAELLGLVEEGLRADPGSTSLLDLQVDLLRRCGKVDEAIAACRNLCTLAPRHDSAFETLGRLLQFYRKDYAGAAQAYEQQLKNRESAAVHNLLGLCLQELERFGEAETQLGRALELAPRCPAFLANLAELHLLQKHYRQAESTYRAALSLPIPRARDRVLMRRRLALLLRRRGDWDGSAELLNCNVKTEYQYDDCRRLAELWAQAGQIDRAQKALREWRRLACPLEPVYLQEWAALLRQTGRDWMALQALRRGAQSSRDCCMKLGDLYAAMGRYPEAMRMFRQLSQDLPDEDEQLDRLAKCQLWSNDQAGAKETAGRGLELLERNCSRYNKTMFYTRKAAFLIAAGRLNDAAAALDQAESSPLCAQCVYPECKDAAALRALLLEQKGQLKEAAELCRTWGTRYPDEVDFRDWEKRIRKKMGKTR